MSHPGANRAPFHVGASSRGDSDWNAERRQHYASMHSYSYSVPPYSDSVPLYTTADIHGIHYHRERNGGPLTNAIVHKGVMQEVKELQERMAFQQINVLKIMLEREHEYARLYKNADCVMGDTCQLLEEQIPKIKKTEKDLDNLITVTG